MAYIKITFPSSNEKILTVLFRKEKGGIFLRNMRSLIKNNIELTFQYVSLYPTQYSRLIFIHFLKELDESIHINALSLW